MNDFVAMQKDVGLISVLGAVDAVRAAQIEVAHTFTYTPYVVAGLLFVLLAIPMIRLTDWLQRAAAPPRADRRGALMAARCCGPIDVRKSFGDRLVLDGISLDLDAHEVVALIGPSRIGQVDAAALPEPARAHRRRPDLARRRRHQRSAGQGRRGARAVRRGVPALQPVPAPHRARQRDAGAPAGARDVAAGRRGTRARPAGTHRPRGARALASRSPLGRSAAARRDRARDRERPRGAAARRDHQRARPRARRRGARAGARARTRTARRS